MVYTSRASGQACHVFGGAVETPVDDRPYPCGHGQQCMSGGQARSSKSCDHGLSEVWDRRRFEALLRKDAVAKRQEDVCIDKIRSLCEHQRAQC
jgi:hypothetical protein